jgi:hypothetical protein
MDEVKVLTMVHLMDILKA